MMMKLIKEMMMKLIKEMMMSLSWTLCYGQEMIVIRLIYNMMKER